VGDSGTLNKVTSRLMLPTTQTDEPEKTADSGMRFAFSDGTNLPGGLPALVSLTFTARAFQGLFDLRHQ
jgi:hypothetical protein